MIGASRSANDRPATVNPALSARQAEIADLIAAGKSNRQVAQSLALSTRTVETHVAAIFGKYGVSTRVELAVARLAAGGPARRHAARTNLPHPRIELVGRDDDVVELVRHLGDARLVTIVGPGGVGKTSVARAVGHRRHADDCDVAFVELVALADGSLVANAVASALDARVARDATALETIVARVGERSTLVVLDNCEHLVSDAAACADALIRACPNVRVLATSREPLRVFGERVYRLPSLRVPSVAQTKRLRARDGAEFAAIALFASRARAADRTFSLDDGNVRTIADISRRLDGIPLALELAAARVTVLSIDLLLARLDVHLRLLRNVDRSVDARHRTMHALVAWSYELLSPEERRLFDCLSVFVDGCELREAAHVYADAVDDLSVLDLLSSLVDKSLVVADVSRSEPRYTLLETVRIFARERLVERGEEDAVVRRHAAAVAERLERLETCYVPTPEWFAETDREIGNVRAAIDATLGRRIDVEIGQRIVAALRPAEKDGEWQWRYANLACDAIDAATPRVLKARLLFVRTGTAFETGRHDLAVELGLQARAAFEAVGDEVEATKAESVAAYAHLMQGRIEVAAPIVERARAIARRIAPTSWTAGLEHGAATIAFARGDVVDGNACLRRALSTYESIGAHMFADQLSISVAEAAFDAGDAAEALDAIDRVMPRLRAHGRASNVCWAQCNAAAYAIALRRWSGARERAVESLDVARSISWKPAIAYALQHLAAIGIENVDASDPRRSPENVARVIGFVDRSLADDGIPRQPHEARERETIVAALRGVLAADALVELFAEGAGATLDQIGALAMATTARHVDGFEASVV